MKSRLDLGGSEGGSANTLPEYCTEEELTPGPAAWEIGVLPLTSPRWSDLRDAYGVASDIPDLLTQLEAFPPDQGPEAEPYFSLWSALCHQGDVFTGSYAAVPHIVRIIGGAPDQAPWGLFQLVACIEIARCQGRGPQVPQDLETAYVAALARVPELVAEAARVRWDHWYCGAALAAIAASKGHWRLAVAVLELDPETIDVMLRHKFGEEQNP
jgi:hypothetical protein